MFGKTIAAVTVLAVAAALACGQRQSYRWERLDVQEWALWDEYAQIGNWKDGDYYRRIKSGEWEETASEPPCPPPAEAKARPRCKCCKGCACKKNRCGCSDGKRCSADCTCKRVRGVDGHNLAAVVEADGKLNFGVDHEQMGQPKHGLSGRDVSRLEVMQAIGGDTLPHDAAMLCLTAIGPASYREQFLAALRSPELAPWTSKVKVKDFDPGHWAVAGMGYVTPSIYCQAPDGQVLYRWDEFPGALAIAEELRRLDPAYDPGRDPGPHRNGLLGDGDGWAGVLISFAALTAFLFVLFFLAIGFLLLLHAARKHKTEV